MAPLSGGGGGGGGGVILTGGDKAQPDPPHCGDQEGEIKSWIRSKIHNREGETGRERDREREREDGR